MGYKVCPYCGANLDPDEKCDCREEAAVPQQGNAAGRRGGRVQENNRKDSEKEENNHE